ncbi:MAG: hypothetical protein DRP08_01155 [Candidatus Aenigmatarchaeota archaeon]|nr:MAG: hypothetical protein DRP08_01155 [Candidatus Aenigmarchaeota archaeon]
MFIFIKKLIKIYKLIGYLKSEIIRLESEYPTLSDPKSKKINRIKQHGVKDMFFKVTGKKWKVEKRFLSP